MTTERWRQIEILFAQAVECPLPERPQFLDRICREDLELRRQLESLLECDAPEERLVEVPPEFIAQGENGDSADDDSPADLTGHRVGAYRVTSLIGQGGMGAVYMGVRDDDQFRKVVAIKILKRGMDTSFMLARFRQERQILANLEHPFIAHLIDGGATEDGLPYFVMEYVDGVPITTFCSQNNLSIDARLRLFQMVCEAVQYAHQNLVVHRDLKPGNILTTREGVPKLLDFGIAKVLDAAGLQDLAVTQRELRMLTPEYASPEQVRGAQISTASDIYSLGAILYELLTERRAHQFPSRSLAAIEQTICDHEPEKPSVAVNRNQDVLPGVRRQWARSLSGDLDNIILTALRKDPPRRYASAAQLSEDLRRHMQALPTIAQGDRWTSRAAKFVRRHRVPVGAAILLIASLIGGIVTTTIQARRAERRFHLVRQLANSVLFDLHNQVERLPGSITARVAMVQTVATYLDNLAQDSDGDPHLELEIATAYLRVGSIEGHPSHSNLGQTASALVHTQRAIDLFEKLIDTDEVGPRAVIGAIRGRIGAASVEERLGHAPQAFLHLQRAARIAQDVASTPGTEPLPADLLVSIHLRLADLESHRGQVEAQLANVQKAVEISRHWADTTPGIPPLNSLRDSYSQFANVLTHAGRLDQARENFSLALQVSARMLSSPGAGDKQRPGLVGIHHLYGELLGAPNAPNLGQPKQAIAEFRAAAELGEYLAAKDAKDVNARKGLADTYCRLALNLLDVNLKESLDYAQKAHELSTGLSALDPRNLSYQSTLASSLTSVGQALNRMGRKAEALANLEDAIRIQQSIEAAAPDQIWIHRTTSQALQETGDAYLDMGDSSRAQKAYLDGLDAADRNLRRAPANLYLVLDRAHLLEALGKFHQALAYRPQLQREARSEHKKQAHAFYSQSLTIWKGWVQEKKAAAFAARQATRLSSEIAALQRP